MQKWRAFCVDAGAKFLTSEGFDLEVVEFAVKEGVVVIPGALTPTEVISGVEGRCGLRQSVSLRAARRRQLHPSSEGGFAPGAVDSRRRRESTDGWQFDSGGSCRAWRRARVDPERGYPIAEGGMGS